MSFVTERSGFMTRGAQFTAFGLEEVLKKHIFMPDV